MTILIIASIIALTILLLLSWPLACYLTHLGMDRQSIYPRKFITFRKFKKLFNDNINKFEYDSRWKNSLFFNNNEQITYKNFNERMGNYYSWYIHADIIRFDGISYIFDPISYGIFTYFMKRNPIKMEYLKKINAAN